MIEHTSCEIKSLRLRWLLVLVAVAVAPDAASAASCSKRIPASYSQSNGKFSYDLPLMLPPAFGDHHPTQPSISVQYSSHGKGGLISSKFDIVGFSQIERCAASRSALGYKAGVTLSETDAFCLDGQILIPVGRSHDSREITYRTSIESWSLVKSFSPSSSTREIASWTVQSGSGTVAIYTGTSPNSVGPIFLTWSVANKTDIHGNIISFSYDAQNGLPTSVSWGGNPSQGTAHSRFVKFEHAPLARPGHLFVAGYNVTREVGIVAASTHVDSLSSAPIFQYKFGLNSTSGRLLVRPQKQHLDASFSLRPIASALKNVSQCATENEQISCCTTTFDWNHVSFTGQSDDKPDRWTPGSTFFLPQAPKYENVLATVPTEANGDGKMDYLIWSQTDKELTASLYLAPFNTEPYVADFTALTGAKVGAKSHFFTLDGEGCGVLDLLVLNIPNDSYAAVDIYLLRFILAESRMRLISTTSVAVSPPNSNIYPTLGDWNGDGRADFAFCTSDNIYLCVSSGKEFSCKLERALPASITDPSFQFTSADVNGDGYSDIIVTSGTTDLKVRTLLALPSEPKAAKFASDFLVQWTQNGNPFEIQIGDLNGDGNSDLLILYSGTNYFSATTWWGLGNGTWSLSSERYILHSVDPTAFTQVVLADVNGDTLDDLVFMEAVSSSIINTYVLLSTGFSFTDPQISRVSQQGLEIAGTRLADFIGNGREHLMILNKNMYLSLFYSGFVSTSFVIEIDEGFNRKIRVDHAFITDEATKVYTPSPEVASLQHLTTYPLKKTTVPMVVVRSYSEYDTHPSLPITKTWNVTYYGMANDVLGGTFNAFQSITLRLPMRQIQTTVYNQTFPAIGTVINMTMSCDSQSSTDARCTAATAPLRMSRQSFDTAAVCIVQVGSVCVWELQTRATSIKQFQYDHSYDVMTTQYEFASLGGSVKKSRTFHNNDKSTTEVVRHYEFALDSAEKWLFGFETAQWTVEASTGKFVWRQNRTYSSDTMDLLTESVWANDTDSWITSSRTYTPYGTVSCLTDPVGLVTQFQYYSPSRPFFLKTRTVPRLSDGQPSTTHFTWLDSFGLKNSSVDNDGSLSLYLYNEWGEQTEQLGPRPNGDKTQLLTTSKFSTFFDASLNLMCSSVSARTSWDDNDASSFKISTLCSDAFDRVVFLNQTGADGPVLAYKTYYLDDSLAFESSAKYASEPGNLGSHYEYDVYGRTTTTVDADGMVTTVKYDDKTGLIRTQRVGALTEDEQVTRITSKFLDEDIVVESVDFLTGDSDAASLLYYYDCMGRKVETAIKLSSSHLVSVSKKGYNSRGGVTSEWALSGNALTYTYSAQTGQFIKMKTLTEKTTWQYGPNGRLDGEVRTTLDGTSSRTVQYVWSGLPEQKCDNLACSIVERISGRTNMTVTHTLWYDMYESVQKTVLDIDGTSYESHYERNPSDHVIRQGFPDGDTLQIDRTLTDVPKNYTFGRAGPLYKRHGFSASGSVLIESFGVDDVVTTSFQYNAVGKMTLLNARRKNGANLLRLDIGYNSVRYVANVTVADVDPNRPYTQRFKYSKLGSLVNALGPYGNISMQYDQLGNLIVRNGITTVYDGFRPIYATDMARKPVYNATYNDAGYLIAKIDHTTSTSWDYIYNELGRLSAVKANGTVVAEYWYDFNGNLIKWRSGATITIIPVEEYEVDLARNTTAKIIRTEESDAPKVQLSSDSGPLFFHGDHLDNTLLVTNAVGEVVCRMQYEPYGDWRALNGTDAGCQGVRFKFSGRLWDSFARLIFFRNRFYDPQLARFISPDPELGGDDTLIASYNRFAYALNNPSSYVDSDGNGVWDAIGSIFVSIGEIALGALADAFGLEPLGNGLIGGGVSGLIYTATNFNDFSWKQYAIDNAVGVLTGLIPGAGAGAKAATRAEQSLLSGERGMMKAVRAEIGAAESAESSVARDVASCILCLPPETPILLGNGSLILLSDITVGMTVSAFNGTHVTHDKRVRAVFETQAIALVDLTVQMCSAEPDSPVTHLQLTPEHPMFSATRGWTASGELQPGETLLNVVGECVRVLARKVVHDDARTVMNVEVEVDHSFFASELLLLVHNPKCKISSTSPLRKKSKQASFARSEIARNPKYKNGYQADHVISLNVAKNAINNGGGLKQKLLPELRELLNHPANMKMVKAGTNMGENNVVDNMVIRNLRSGATDVKTWSNTLKNSGPKGSGIVKPAEMRVRRMARRLRRLRKIAPKELRPVLRTMRKSLKPINVGGKTVFKRAYTDMAFMLRERGVSEHLVNTITRYVTGAPEVSYSSYHDITHAFAEMEITSNAQPQQIVDDHDQQQHKKIETQPEP